MARETGTMIANDRVAPRHKVFLKARITFNRGASSFDCIVRELSAVGARLVLSETSMLPETFDLHIPQKGKTYRSALRWRREDGVGVAFPDEVGLAVPPTNVPDNSGTEASRIFLLRRLGELEVENVALRRMLAEGIAEPREAGL